MDKVPSFDVGDAARPSSSPLGERNATRYLNPIVRSIDLGKRLRVEVTVEFAFLDRR